MTWHAGTAELSRYATGEVDDATASSVEAHLVSCDQCRAQVATHVDPLRLERLWEGVLDAVDQPRILWAERVLVRLGIADHTARLLAATPSLQLSWLASVAVALMFSVVAAHGGSEGLTLFLTVAPLVPLAGVAAAFGPELDRSQGITAATPLAGWRLLMLRGCAVFSVTVALAGLAALALPEMHWTSAAWLLPALGLSLAALGLSAFMSVDRAAGAVAVAWVAVVMAASYGDRNGLAAFGATGQACFLLLIALAAAVVVRQRDALEIRSRS
ncbi:MAG TPA: zf-HC2 domain-containing protein [Acidimicrobiales bacterium]|nr:zf-HC2 domain-containing protein [Acidimicrobiales bacterium]